MKRVISLLTALVLGICSMVSSVSAYQELSTKYLSYTKDFVYTDGTSFMLNGKPFYYAGSNNYYINFKHKADVDNLMQDAQDMGLKVIRTWGFLDVGTWTGTNNTTSGYPIFNNNSEGTGEKEGVYYQYFDPVLNKPVVNEGADGLRYLDYAIYSASKHGIKLLVTFVNNWEQFGGMPQYCKWAKQAGETIKDDHDDFYTNETIKSWYKNYISTLLNRENYYSGICYKDDPAVFAWELANESRCESDKYCANNVTYNWATEMSQYVKSIDPNHLLAVGDEGFTNYGYSDFEQGDHKYVYYGSSGMDFNKLMTIPGIDFGTPHIYCDQWGLTDAQAKFWFAHHYEICKKNNKPVILEEFNWKERSARAEILRGWFDVLEGKDSQYPDVKFAGSNFWMLASVMEAENKLYQDYDGYTIYYRNDTDGTPNPTASSLAVVMDHAAYMNSKCLNNSVSEDKFEFNKYDPSDIAFETLFDLGSLSSISLNEKTLKSGTDYTATNNTVMFKQSYLNSLDDGYAEFMLNCTSGNTPTVTVKVYDSTIADAKVSPANASFFKNASYQQDIKVGLTSNGRTFRGVYNGNNRLDIGDDYILEGNTITIKKEYLSTLVDGTNSIRFDFDRGIDPKTDVNVSEFKEKYECESDFDFGSIEGWEHSESQFDGATCVRMRSNKSGIITVEIPADGKYIFTMRAMSKYKELSNALYIDGVNKGTFNIAVTPNNLNDSTVTAQLTKGLHEIKVQFGDSYDSLNDYLKITAVEIGEVNPFQTDSDTDIITDIDTSSETDTESDVESDIESDTESDIESDIESDTESDIESDIEGDASGDNKLDIIDVVLTRAHIVGNNKFADEKAKRCADINKDGNIDIIDVVMMRSKIVNTKK